VTPEELITTLARLQAQTVSEFQLSMDYEGCWSCLVSWANEGESCRGASMGHVDPLAAVAAALLDAESTK
jgi:hypothetical protein